jgi:hypothetical protein
MSSPLILSQLSMGPYSLLDYPMAWYSYPDCPEALFYLYEDQEFIIPKIYNFSGSEVFYLDVGTVQAS